MSANLQPDHEAVRTLAVAVGVREAARKLGLNEDRVRQWSSRENWFAAPPQPPTVTKHLVTTVTKPSQALADSLAEYGKETRLNLIIAARKAAQTFSEHSGSEVIDKSRQLKDVVAASSTLHGWEEGKEGIHPSLSLNILTGNCVVVEARE